MNQDLSSQTANKLALTGNSLIFVYLLIILFGSFPFRLIDPVWLGVVTDLLLNNGGFALVGVALLALSSYIDPENIQLTRHQQFINSLCFFITFIYFSLIPTQLYVSYRNIQSSNVQYVTQFKVSLNQVKLFEEKVQSAKDFDNLQTIMRTYQGMSIPESERIKPLQTVKSFLLSKIQDAKKLLIVSQKPALLVKAKWQQFQLASRNVLWSLIYIISFSAFAQRRDSTKSLLQETSQSIFTLLEKVLRRRERRLQALEEQATLAATSDGPEVPNRLSRQQQQGLIDPLWLNPPGQQPDEEPWELLASDSGSGDDVLQAGAPPPSSETTNSSFWKRLRGSVPRRGDEATQFLVTLADQHSSVHGVDSISETTEVSPPQTDAEDSASQHASEASPLPPSSEPQQPSGRRDRQRQRLADVDYFEELANDHEDITRPGEHFPG